MLKLLQPLLKVNFRIPGTIRREQPILFIITQLISYLAALDELRTCCRGTIFEPNYKLGDKIFHYFSIFVVLQSDIVFGIVNPFS